MLSSPTIPQRKIFIILNFRPSARYTLKMFPDDIQNPLEEIYKKAYRSARKSSKKAKKKGDNPNIPSLTRFIDSILTVGDIYRIREVPISRILGTVDSLRSVAFSPEYYPLFKLNTSFSESWQEIYSQISQDKQNEPLLAFEIFNWYFICDGNKRTSVSKYMNKPSLILRTSTISPSIIEKHPKIFSKFLSLIGLVYFSSPKNEEKLEEIIDSYAPQTKTKEYEEDPRIYFINQVYWPFRQICHDILENPKRSYVGDLFVDYVERYGFPEGKKNNIKKNIKQLIKEEKRKVKY
jgi:hypothetical protein